MTPAQQRLLEEPLTSLDLDTRIKNALENPDYPPVVTTVRELLMCRPEDLLRIPNFGQKALRHVLQCLARHGFVAASLQPPLQSGPNRAQQRLEQLQRDVLGF